eukprot:1923876-Amphidinium_carterae.1
MYTRSGLQCSRLALWRRNRNHRASIGGGGEEHTHTHTHTRTHTSTSTGSVAVQAGGTETIAGYTRRRWLFCQGVWRLSARMAVEVAWQQRSMIGGSA